MEKIKALVAKHWKPLLILASTGAASYFGGPLAGQAALDLLTSLFG